MFNFPGKERDPDFHYKNNLLKSVTFQVKFQPNQAILERKKEIGDRLKSFPIVNPVFDVKAEFKIEKDKTPIVESGHQVSGFEYKDENNQKIIHLTLNALTFTIFGPSYTNFKNSFEEISTTLLPIMDLVEVNTFSRIAIRKVNLLEANVEEKAAPVGLISQPFNKFLVDHMLSNPGGKFIDSGLSSITFSNNFYRLNLNYGLLPQNVKIKNRQIILDIDLFSIEENVDKNRIGDELKKINDEIFNIFHWAIKEEFINKIN